MVGAEEFLEEECPILWWRDCELVETFDFVISNGDGTVPLHSADLYNDLTGMGLRGASTNVYADGVGHGELTQVDGVLDFAVDFLCGDGVESQTARITALSESLIGETPQPLPATELVVRSPDPDVVVDGAGNELGSVEKELGIELTTIPGGTYFTSPDSEQFVLSDPGVYEGTWSITESDEMNFSVRGHADNSIVLYATTGPFSVEPGAEVGIEFTNPFDPASANVRIDDDGDGTVNRTIPFLSQSGTESFDAVAPVASANVTRYFDGSQWLAEVVLQATDEGGSGVAYTEFALDVSLRARRPPHRRAEIPGFSTWPRAVVSCVLRALRERPTNSPSGSASSPGFGTGHQPSNLRRPQ